MLHNADMNSPRAPEPASVSASGAGGATSGSRANYTSIPAAFQAGRRLAVLADVAEDGSWRRITVNGQVARLLLALHVAGWRGCTAAEVSGWALRFAAYCHDLIHDHGVQIRTEKEEHVGGWHGRHVLEATVRIVAVNGVPTGEGL